MWMACFGSAQITSYGPGGPQPGTGTFKEISLATLDIHIDIPLVAKSGVWLASAPTISFDNNFWNPNYGHPNEAGDMVWSPNSDNFAFSASYNSFPSVLLLISA
jgi:hypothetical protein